MAEARDTDPSSLARRLNLTIPVGGIASLGEVYGKTRAGASLAQLIEAAVFQTRLIPIRRNPGFRNAIEPLNRQ